MKFSLVSIFLYAFLSSFVSCKYEDDSIYSYNHVNFPQVEECNFPTVDVTLLTACGEVTKSGPSNLIRCGHLWGSVPDLSFEAENYFDFSEHVPSGNFVDPYRYFSEIHSFDKTLPLYIRPYAINQAGIGLGIATPQKICSQVYLDRFTIIGEQTNNGTINSGERVTVRFFFKNRSVIEGISPKISFIPSSNAYSMVAPYENLPTIPNKITLSQSAYVDLVLQFATFPNPLDPPRPSTIVVKYVDQNCHIGGPIELFLINGNRISLL